jgi:hypothetical protein
VLDALEITQQLPIILLLVFQLYYNTTGANNAAFGCSALNVTQQLLTTQQ